MPLMIKRLMAKAAKNDRMIGELASQICNVNAIRDIGDITIAQVVAVVVVPVVVSIVVVV